MNAGQVAPAQVVLLLGQHNNRAALGSFIGKRRELRGVGQPLLAHIRRGHEFRCLPVAESDGARLVEQQRVHVAGGFNGAPAHGQHVVLHQPVHAGDADGRQQPADGGGNEAHQQRNQHKYGLRSLRVHGEGLQRDHSKQENDREAGEQNAERDLVGRLLAGCALHQRDHAIEKSFAGIGGDLDLDPVRQHLGAAGNGRAVAAGFADDRSGFAGNGRLVHRSHALDDFAVAGDVVAGFDVDDVSCAKQAADDLFKAAVGGVALGNRLALGLAQGIGLGLAAALGHGLGKVGEQHREPQPERDLQVEAEGLAVMAEVFDEQAEGEHAAHFHHKHHGVLHHPAWIELAKAVHAGLGQ